MSIELKIVTTVLTTVMAALYTISKVFSKDEKQELRLE